MASLSIRSQIVSQTLQVAQEHSLELPPLVDDVGLLELGLDSLGFATLVARLEDAFGFDPFSSSDDAYFPVTLGDFINAYEDGTKKIGVTL